ncbi:hypothetical protein HDV05_004307 [Chytridiales sp. JEL 0842]|nr:hypothetical protein HDV05_004307 [Chytridiales sp. JEL 0842]
MGPHRSDDDQSSITTKNSQQGSVFQLEKVLNVRDAGENKIGKDGRAVRAGLLLRGARPEEASDSDILFLTRKLNIRTVIDLRSAKERHQGLDKSLFRYPDGSYRPSFADHYATFEQKPTDGGTYAARRRYTFDLARVIQRALWPTLSFWTKLVFVFYIVTFRRRQAVQFALKRSIFAEEGLFALNKFLLQHSQTDIAKVFDLLCDPASYPVYIHCTAGKDRTGLIIALVLMLLGVSDQVIVTDYMRTQKLLASERGRMIAEAGKLGFGQNFIDITPDIMERTMAFVKERYGSAEGYLTVIGVGPEKRALLEKTLLEE